VCSVVHEIHAVAQQHVHRSAGTGMLQASVQGGQAGAQLLQLAADRWQGGICRVGCNSECNRASMAHRGMMVWSLAVQQRQEGLLVSCCLPA